MLMSWKNERARWLVGCHEVLRRNGHEPSGPLSILRNRDQAHDDRTLQKRIEDDQQPERPRNENDLEHHGSEEQEEE